MVEDTRVCASGQDLRVSPFFLSSSYRIVPAVIITESRAAGAGFDRRPLELNVLDHTGSPVSISIRCRLRPVLQNRPVSVISGAEQAGEGPQGSYVHACFPVSA